MWVVGVISSLLLAVSSGQDDCGRTTVRSLKDRLGLAKPGQYPAMCQLFITLENRNVFWGGATLIQNNQLASLASLTINLTDESVPFDLRQEDEQEECRANQIPNRRVSAKCGSVNLQSDDSNVQFSTSQTRDVGRIVMHPDFNPRSLVNDMAVLIVDQPFDYTSTVGQVCLPLPGEKRNPGERCVAMGHGKDNDGQSGIYSPELQEVSLPIFPRDECEDVLNNKHFIPNHQLTGWKLDESFLCAGGEFQRDTCVGDGGGPLLCQVQDRALPAREDEDYSLDDLDLRQGEDEELRLVQAGITAWGIGCGMDGFPGVYSDMESASCWLDQIMSCYPTDRGDEDIINEIGLRQGGSPPSARGLSESQCGDWVQSQSAGKAACGCRQRLVSSDPLDEDFLVVANDLDLRGNAEIRASDIDLRNIERPKPEEN